MLWVQILIRARCTTFCNKVCQWLATGRWFSPGPSVSSTNKTDCHDITEILLKVALNTTKQTNKQTNKQKKVWRYQIGITRTRKLKDRQESDINAHYVTMLASYRPDVFVVIRQLGVLSYNTRVSDKLQKENNATVFWANNYSESFIMVSNSFQQTIQ